MQRDAKRCKVMQSNAKQCKAMQSNASRQTLVIRSVTKRHCLRFENKLTPGTKSIFNEAVRGIAPTGERWLPVLCGCTAKPHLPDYLSSVAMQSSSWKVFCCISTDFSPEYLGMTKSLSNNGEQHCPLLSVIKLSPHICVHGSRCVHPPPHCPFPLAS